MGAAPPRGPDPLARRDARPAPRLARGGDRPRLPNRRLPPTRDTPSPAGPRTRIQIWTLEPRISSTSPLCISMASLTISPSFSTSADPGRCGAFRYLDGGSAAEVGQREAVAGGLGGGFLVQRLTKVPVVPLVQVEEADHLALGSEADVAELPAEAEAPAADALGPVGDPFPERPPRLGDLDHDRVVVEAAVRGQVGARPVAQGLDHEPVAIGRGQAGQRGSDPGRVPLLQPRLDPHDGRQY